MMVLDGLRFLKIVATLFPISPPTHAQNVHEALLKGLRAESLREVLFKGPIMHPAYPSNGKNVFQMTSFRYVLIMAWDGLRFLEFAIPLPPFSPHPSSKST